MSFDKDDYFKNENKTPYDKKYFLDIEIEEEKN